MSNGFLGTILIVDDEDGIRDSLSDILEDEHYEVITAANATEARGHYLKSPPDLVLLDIWMPDIDGISLLREWQSQGNLRCPVIIMSGHGTIETAVEATKLGAFYFLEKPLSTAKLLLTVERALQTQSLISQNEKLKAQIDPPLSLIANSEAMKQVSAQAQNLFKQSVAVLILGAFGTGRKHLAKYIHQNSPKKDERFLELNFENLEPEEAAKALEICVKECGNGSLYITEIAQVPLELQKTILRLIGEQKIRIFAASTLNPEQLKEIVEPQLFDVITIACISLPSLSARSEDISDLLEYFCNYFANYEQLPYRHFTLAAQNALRQHQWLGNVQELKNLVQRLLIQGKANPEIDIDEAKNALTPIPENNDTPIWLQFIPKDLSLREAREEFERQYLLAQFKFTGGNIAKLAGRVGMDRTNLYRKLRSLNINPTEKPEK